MRTLFATLVALAFALSASAAFAGEFSGPAEPFAKSAAIYADGFQAFGPSAGVLTREDLVGEPMGIPKPGSGSGVGSPWLVYRLKDPGRFKLEVQTMGHEFDPRMHPSL